MHLGHRIQVRRMGLGGLLLDRLERGEHACRRGSSVDRRLCRRRGGRAPAGVGGDVGRRRTCLHGALRGAGEIGGRQGSGGRCDRWHVAARRVRSGQLGQVSGRIRTAGIGAVDGQGELRARAPVRVGDVGVAVPQGAQVHRDTHGGETPEAPHQPAQPTCPLVVGGDGGVLTAVEDPAHQTGQHRRGADLDEGTHACVVHRFDGLDETYRPCQLSPQLLADGRGVARVRPCRLVRVHGDVRRTNADLCEVLGECVGRAGDDRRMERRGDGQPFERDDPSDQFGLDPFDLGCTAGQDHLRMAVVVGDDHVGIGLVEHGTDVLDGCRHGRHRARCPRRVGHRLAAASRHRDHVGVAERAGGV